MALRRFEWVKRKGEAARLSQRHRIVSPRRTRRSQKLIESYKNPPLGTPQLAREFFTLRVLRALRGEFFVTSGLASQPASVPCEPKLTPSKQRGAKNIELEEATCECTDVHLCRVLLTALSERVALQEASDRIFHDTRGVALLTTLLGEAR